MMQRNSQRGFTVLQLSLIIAAVVVVVVLAIVLIPKLTGSADERAERKAAEKAYESCIADVENKEILDEVNWFVLIDGRYYIQNEEGKLVRTDEVPRVGDMVIKEDGTLTEPDRPVGGPN